MRDRFSRDEASHGALGLHCIEHRHSETGRDLGRVGRGTGWVVSGGLGHRPSVGPEAGSRSVRHDVAGSERPSRELEA